MSFNFYFVFFISQRNLANSDFDKILHTWKGGERQMNEFRHFKLLFKTISNV